MILSIDTSTEAFSIAIELQNGNIVEHYQLAPRLHSKLFLGTLDQLLADNNINKNQLTAIVFGKGPGSFTGVRIAVSVAQGLSVGLHLPIVGISTLASMAQYQYRKTQNTHFSCAIDARMKEIYWGEYRIIDGIATLVGQEAVLAPAKATLASTTEAYSCIGSGWISYQNELSEQLSKHLLLPPTELFPHAYDMIALAKTQLANKQGVDILDAIPTYLRNKVAKTIKEREQSL